MIRCFVNLWGKCNYKIPILSMTRNLSKTVTSVNKIKKTKAVSCLKCEFPTAEIRNTQHISKLFYTTDLKTLSDITLDHPKLQSLLNIIRKEYTSILKENPDTISMENKIMYRFNNVLKPIVDRVNIIEHTQEDVKELDRIILDTTSDSDIIKMAKTDKEECLQKITCTLNEILSLLVPDKTEDQNDIIIEFSCGVGGQEAMLFTNDILNMYLNFIQEKGWEYEITHCDESELGGLKSATLMVSGKHAYKYLRYEGGVHRVQRVPTTERGGRIHTSTMSVVILQQPSQVDISIDPKDLKMETKTSSSAGGQHVNKTESAVRLHHIPTGITVECQTQRSQNLNKEIAVKKLRALLYQRKLDNEASKRASSRKLQVSSLARSEKIRTYNYVQDRITDHRIGFSLYSLGRFMEGGRPLQELMEKLHNYSQVEELNELLDGAK